MRFLDVVAAAPVAMVLLIGCNSSVWSEGAGGAGGAGGATSTSSAAGGAGGCADPADPAVFEIGTGQTCFERLTAGQTVAAIQGPQGGFHLWLAVGCADCGAQAVVRYGVKDPATQDWYAGTGSQEQVLPLDPDGWPQGAGLTAFLPGFVYDPATQLPEGTHVVLYGAALDDSMAVKHEAQVEVVLGPVEIWDPPCDENPATCGQPGGNPCCYGKQGR